MRSKLVTLMVFGMLNYASPVLAENLLDIYQQARANDPLIKSAQYSRTAANESKVQARAGFRPQVNLGASAAQNWNTIRGNATDFTALGYNLSLTQPIYHRNTYVNDKRSDAVISQAESEYQNVQQTLILRSAQAYFGVLAAEDNLGVANAEKAAFEQQLDLARQRFKVGLNTMIDVNEAQAAFDAAVAREIATRNQVDVAHEILREITTQRPTRLSQLPADISLVSPQPAEIDQWVSSAHSNNLQLASLRQQLEQARQDVELARSGKYPTVDLVGSHRYTDKSAFGSTTITDIVNNSLTLQLNVPLYQAGLTDSQVRQSQLRLSAAEESYEQQKRAVERNTRSAYLEVMTGISRVQSLKQATLSSQSALEASEAGLQVGTRTTVDVLNARKELFRVQGDYAKARYDYVLATLRLKQASGQLSQADLEQLNGWLK